MMSNSKRKLLETVGMKKKAGKGSNNRRAQKARHKCKKSEHGEMSLVERLSVEYGSTWYGTKAHEARFDADAAPKIMQTVRISGRSRVESL